MTFNNHIIHSEIYVLYFINLFNATWKDWRSTVKLLRITGNQGGILNYQQRYANVSKYHTISPWTDFKCKSKEKIRRHIASGKRASTRKAWRRWTQKMRGHFEVTCTSSSWRGEEDDTPASVFLHDSFPLLSSRSRALPWLTLYI